MNEIEIFGSFSGLILNRNKTEGIWIGKLKNCKDKIRGIKWTQNPVKALGIFFSFIYIFGTTHELAKKVNFGRMSVFIIRIFPIIALKVSWVKRLLSPKTSNWKVIPRKYLDKFGKNWLIFKMNM
jgi:hypothetical protein